MKDQPDRMPEMTATELQKRQDEWWTKWQEAEARLLQPIVDRVLELARRHTK